MPDRVVRYELGAATDTEFAVYVVEVFLHSVLLDSELAGDLLVRQTFAQVGDSLRFAPGEVWLHNKPELVTIGRLRRSEDRLFQPRTRQPQSAPADRSYRLCTRIGRMANEHKAVETIVYNFLEQARLLAIA